MTININLLKEKKINKKAEALQRKFVSLAIIVLVSLFALVILCSRAFMEIYNNRSVDYIASVLLENNFIIPDSEIDKTPFINAETQYTLRYFTVVEQNGPLSADFKHISKINQQSAIEMYQKVKTKNDKGNIGTFRFQFLKESDCAKAIFISKDVIEENKNLATAVMLIVLLISLFILSLILSICSQYVIAPFVESSEAQKQFITDASHDLKTPLAVIMSNTEVTEMIFGKNEWTEAIKHETKRMAELIDDMLTLSRLEAIDIKKEPVEIINLSDMVNNEVDIFSEIWKQRNITVKKMLNKDVNIKGHKKQLQRLLSVLIQNATKYCLENGSFEVKVAKEKNKTYIKLYNDAMIESDINYDKLFERFYRDDTSRSSKTGGHGIGLSIAKKICDMEGYTISAYKSKNGIAFKIIF